MKIRMHEKDALIARALAGKVDYMSLSPQKTQVLTNEFAVRNYREPAGLVTQIASGIDDCTLLLRFLGLDGSKCEKLVIDCHAMYSVHNLGYQNESSERMKSVVLHHVLSDFPETGRDKNHPFFPAFLIAARKATGMDKFLPKLGGAEVVDTAVWKIARKFWRQKHGMRDIPCILPLSNCFHGRTFGTAALSSNERPRNEFYLYPFAPGVIQGVPFGNIEALKEAFMSYRGKIAVVVAEPVQGEGGVIVPPDGYLRELIATARENDAVVVFDEIQTGMGRTGGTRPEDLFVYQDEELMPDIMCAGKAAGGGRGPFSFIGGKKEVMDCIGPGEEGATWSGYALGCKLFSAAADETIKKKYAVRSREKGAYMLSLLKDAALDANRRHKIVRDVRGRGLFIGFELEPSLCTGREFSYALLLQGVWAKETGETGQTIRFAPPLTISKAQIECCAGAVERALCLVRRDRAKIQNALSAQENL